jgi:predicted HTH domain antitoxin
MNVIGIKELQTNPGKISQTLEQGQYVLITRRGVPLGVALPFSDQLLEHGLKNWMALTAFQAGDLSLWQLAKVLGKNRHETLELLGNLKIPVADYDLQEDLDTLDELFPA